MYRLLRCLWALGLALGFSAMVPAATPAAHPDLSGIWTTYIEPGAPPPARQRGPAKLPFTAAAQAKVDAYRALVGPGGDSPGAHCLGSGMPESMTFSGGYPMEIIQRPEQITIIYEAHSEIRRLYFASKVIAPGDRVPARNGYSIAHWEGDTLVVETTSLKEQEDSSYPHSEQAQILERYHLTKSAKGTPVLVDDWVLTDPAFYTEPVSRQKKWALDPKGILLPYECDEETWLDHLEDLKKAAAARSAAPH